MAVWTSVYINGNFVDKKKLYPTRKIDNPPNYNLTTAELQAIKTYTEDTNSIAYTLNQALFTHSPLNDELTQLKADLDSGLAKLPPYVGNVTHAVEYFANTPNKQLLLPDNFEVDQVIPINMFLSTSTNAEVNRKFLNNTPQKIIAQILSKTGRDIVNYSHHPKENEVIFPVGSQFKILDIQHNVTGLVFLNEHMETMLVKMEEI